MQCPFQVDRPTLQFAWDLTPSRFTPCFLGVLYLLVRRDVHILKSAKRPGDLVGGKPPFRMVFLPLVGGSDEQVWVVGVPYVYLFGGCPGSLNTSTPYRQISTFIATSKKVSEASLYAKTLYLTVSHCRLMWLLVLGVCWKLVG